MGCDDIKKTESDNYVILFFSVLTLVFNIYLLLLKCTPVYPDKLILGLCLIITALLVIFIPVKVVQKKDGDETEMYVKDILDISHWGYIVVVPLAILLSKSIPMIILFLNVSWFALIGRAIYKFCPLTSIAEKSTQVNVNSSLVNLFFILCVLIAMIRIIIN